MKLICLELSHLGESCHFIVAEQPSDLQRIKEFQLRNTAEYNNHRLLNDQQLKRRQKSFIESFDNRFPELSHVSFEHLYSGVEGVTANKTNIFKKLSNNLYFAGCYNGSGITKGTAFGCGNGRLRLWQ